MPAINSDNAEAWKQLAKDVDAQRPSVGKRIHVVGGRKHKGKTGSVVAHTRSRFGSAFRYGGEANLHLREMMGRHGFIVLVHPDDNGWPFWVDADKVEVLP